MFHTASASENPILSAEGTVLPLRWNRSLFLVRPFGYPRLSLPEDVGSEMECLDEVFSFYSALHLDHDLYLREYTSHRCVTSSILVTPPDANSQKYPPGRHSERTHTAIGYTLRSWYITSQTGVETAGEADDAAFFVVVDVASGGLGDAQGDVLETTPSYRPPFPKIMV